MRLRLLSAATLEIKAACDYYESEQMGLGEAFWKELDAHLLWINNNPTLPRLRGGKYRRVNLKRFPYYIAYLVQGEEILVLAVPCSYSEPEFWIDRL